MRALNYGLACCIIAISISWQDFVLFARFVEINKTNDFHIEFEILKESNLKC